MNSFGFFNYLEGNQQRSGVLLNGIHYSLARGADIIDLANNLHEFNSNDLTRHPKLKDDEIDFLCPVVSPGKVICVGLNYEDHVKELNRQTLEFPTFFSRFNHSFVPHGKNISISNLSEKYDYEAELAIVIGSTAYRVEKSKAASYICGFSIFNDVTVRDYQARTSQWFLGKNFYQTGSFGPYLVPAQCLTANAQGLKLQTYVNERVLQSANTSDMIFKPDELVYELAKIMPLEKGDVIITGTPGGVAISRNPRTFLKNGDVCRIEIDGLGMLENKFVNDGHNF
jgi:acylpyruvate hydrolase